MQRTLRVPEVASAVASARFARLGQVGRPAADVVSIDLGLAGHLPEVLSGRVFARADLEREAGRLDG